MPQRIREMVLDRCLSDSTRRYSTQDLMDACNRELEAQGFPPVNSLNTTRKDIDEIVRRWKYVGGDVVLEKQGRNKYYHYSDPNFSIYKAGLTAEDLIKVNQALQVLSRFQGMPQFAWMEEWNARIKSSLMMSADTRAVISFEDALSGDGKSFLTTLFDAIDGKCVCTVTYQSLPAEEPQRLRVHPYYLKEYDHRWYLLAWSEVQGHLVTLALDHMLQVETESLLYRVNKEIDFSAYFEEVVGVTVEPEVPTEPVKLWVSPDQCARVQAQPLHASQQVLESHEDGSVVIQIDVKISDELVRRLLSWGEKVVVLSPNHLRKLVQDHIWWMGESYAHIQ